MTSLTVDGALAFGTLTAPGFLAEKAASHASDSDASASGLGRARHPPAPLEAKPRRTRAGKAASAASAAAPARVGSAASTAVVVKISFRSRSSSTASYSPQLNLRKAPRHNAFALASVSTASRAAASHTVAPLARTLSLKARVVSSSYMFLRAFVLNNKRDTHANTATEAATSPHTVPSLWAATSNKNVAPVTTSKRTASNGLTRSRRVGHRVPSVRNGTSSYSARPKRRGPRFAANDGSVACNATTLS